MSDPLREETSPSGPPDVDRDAKIEELLLAGLDHYFSAHFEQAIHVWTRVLFLDRGHDRARAYIERARSALAERQRESEELLHSGEAAFDRGDIDAARRLITSSLDRGGPQDVALALLERLDRLEGASGQIDRTTTGRARRPDGVREPRTGRSGAWLRPAVFLLLSVAILAGLAVYATEVWDLESLLLQRDAAPVTAAPMPDAPLPIPAGAELLLARAQTQFERGHLREALLLLDRVEIGDTLKPEADLLRGAVQRALLSATSTETVAAPPRTPQDPAPR